MRKRFLRFALACAVMALQTAWAATVTLSGPHRDLVERTEVIAHVDPTQASDRLDCSIAPVLHRVGNRHTIVVRRLPPGVGAGCGGRQRSLGELAAGVHRVVVEVRAADGHSVVDRIEREFRVLPLDGRCNAYPEIAPQIMATMATMSGTNFKAKVESDPAYAASMGHPLVEVRPGTWTASREVLLTYPPLEDPVARSVKLKDTGEFASVSLNSQGCFATPPPDSGATFVEFYNDRLDHYFYTSSPAEIADIEAGTVGEGWRRIGPAFAAATFVGCRPASPRTVAYRFTGMPDVGPSTHVFTIDRQECHVVDRSGVWLFEGIAFFARPLEPDGRCAQPGEVPLRRAWKPFGVSNHRFTVSPAVVADMVAQGWIDEGSVMCVTPP